MSLPRIYVLSIIPNLIKELRKALPSCKFIEATTDGKSDLKDAEILIADFDLFGPHLYKTPNMKWVQGTWAGVDALRPHIIAEKGLPYPIVRYSGEHFGRIMSEYVVACIVIHERNFIDMFKKTSNKIWCKEEKFSDYRIISDLTIGVLGTGNIGSRLGNVLKIFGAKVLAYGRRNNIDEKEYSYVSKYYTKETLAEFLKECDYIVNTLPKTPETTGILNGNILKVCSDKQSVLINVGRGNIIADNDLIAAVKNKWISGAYLDVFNTEPLPDSSELWTLPQVKISPHVAAMSRARDIAEQFTENLARYEKKEQFPTIFQLERGY